MAKAITALLMSAACFGSGCASTSTQTFGTERQKHPARHGTMALRLATDDKGNISSVGIVKSSGDATVDASSVDYVKRTWHGPPNSIKEFELEWRKD